MEYTNIKLWKVVELREELKRRGLNAVGPKALLVQRMEAALIAENPKSEDEKEEEVPSESLEDQKPVGKPENEETIDIPDDNLVEKSPTVVEEIEETNIKEAASRSSPLDEKLSPEKENTSIKETAEISRTGELSDSSEDSKRESVRKFSRSPSVGKDTNERRFRKRSRSKSPRRYKDDGRQDKLENIYLTRAAEEPFNWEQRTDVHLDWYNSDLNIIIDTCGLKARPLSVGGFNFMWGGVRANYGILPELMVQHGYKKVGYKLLVTEHLDVTEEVDRVGSPHITRVGWSFDTGDFSVGEKATSWGYGENGKKYHDGTFVDFGPELKEKDVIVAWLDLQSERIGMGFTINGKDYDAAFEVELDECCSGQSFFPQIMLKNVAVDTQFERNADDDYIPQDVTLIGDIPLDCRTRSQLPPESMDVCEITMMCGLPGCGKSYWANNHSNTNPHMRYCTLGTNLCLDKMKTMVPTRKSNYGGRWSMLIEKSTKCLNQLIEVACSRRKNYILDQTNVYPGAQSRKMRSFDGFIRKAVVVVPTDEEFRRRIDKRSREEGKDVPTSAVLEMKANFKIPEDREMFQEITFPELQPEEARELILKYNAEGMAAKSPSEKRTRGDDRSSDYRQSSRREESDGRRYGNSIGGGGGGVDSRDRDAGMRSRRRSPSRSRSRSPFDKDRRSGGSSFGNRRTSYEPRRPQYDDNRFDDRRGPGGFRMYGDMAQRGSNFRPNRNDDYSGRGFGGRGRGGYDGGRGGRGRGLSGRGGLGYRGGPSGSSGFRTNDQSNFRGRGDDENNYGRRDNDNFQGRRNDRGNFGGGGRGGYYGSGDRGGRAGGMGQSTFPRERYGGESADNGRPYAQERQQSCRDYQGGNDPYRNPYASYVPSVESRGGRQQPGSGAISRSTGRPSRFSDNHDAPAASYQSSYRPPPSASNVPSYNALPSRFQNPKVDMSQRQQSRVSETNSRSYTTSYSRQSNTAASTGIRPPPSNRQSRNSDSGGLPHGTLSNAYVRPPPVESRNSRVDAGLRTQSYRDSRVGQQPQQSEPTQKQFSGHMIANEQRSAECTSAAGAIPYARQDQNSSNATYAPKQFQQPPPNFGYQQVLPQYQADGGAVHGINEQQAFVDYNAYYGHPSQYQQHPIQAAALADSNLSASATTQPVQNYDSYYAQQYAAAAGSYNGGVPYPQTDVNQTRSSYSGYDYTAYQQYYSQPPPGQ